MKNTLIQIFQPADISGQTLDSVITINPEHVRCVRLYVVDGQQKRGTAVFVFNESHIEYVHFPAYNYSEVLQMIRETFQ